jgi:5-methylthioadenosine/S-adenosylhomocysteine deaminase
MTAQPIDPATGASFALSGRVVTMSADRAVLEHGVIYAENGSIVAVQEPAAPKPEGFDAVPVVSSRGTIYPGLIELHNHMPYDVLGLWQVPRTYGNRDQWSGSSTPQYHQLITGPMKVLGSDPAVVAAVVRYVEVRALLGGTTTSQGVTLSSVPGLVTHFKGLVRNVEATGDPALPNAATHIADVAATDAQKFLAEISKSTKLILHLSEGTDTAAHAHFAALQYHPGQWAITPNLIGIHCVALQDPDFATFAAHGGSMVWSPLSNLLLYGNTANLGAARTHGVPVALGSDWSPSGSKNLLGELKVARLTAGGAGAPDLTDADLVAMVTCTPAQMLGWGGAVGSLEAGKKADLLVVEGTAGDPYAKLIDATEADLELVMINGVPRVGTPALMGHLGAVGELETIEVGGRRRALFLAQPTADAAVEAVSVAEAQQRLRTAMQHLPDVPAASAATAETAVSATATATRAAAPRLAVAGVVDNKQSPRPHLPLHGQLTGPNLPNTRTLGSVQAAVTAAGPLPALTLDPLTAVDNPAFYDTLAAELNLPAELKAGLARYRHTRR